MRRFLEIAFATFQPADRIEWLISSTRVVLVGFWLLAAYFDPFEDPRYSENVAELLVIYFVFSAAVVAVAFAGMTRNSWQALVHVIDIAAISLLLYLTRGPLSPFFLFFSFVLFSATLRWSWRGAAITASVLVVTTGLLAWHNWPAGDLAADDDFELNRVMLRLAFLVMSGVMLSWFGYVNEVARRRLSQLAEWPNPTSDEFAPAETPLAATMGHIAKVMNAPRILVWCSWIDKPDTDIWFWKDNSLHHERRAGRFSDVPNWTQQTRTGGANAGVLERRRRVLAATFTSDTVTGGISLPDRLVWTADDLFMMEIIVSRVQLELEHQQLREQHEMYAASRERERLARDLHDGVLQTLTAARLQLAEVAEHGVPTARTLENVRVMIRDEQGRLREFRQQLLKTPQADSEIPLTQLQEEIAARQRMLWQCSITTYVSPPSATVAGRLAAELNYMISEAVGNAVRHGKASDVRVDLEKQLDRVMLTVADDGRGFDGIEGEFDLDQLRAAAAGPASLIRRTRVLNGSLTLATSSSGVVLRISLPLPMGNP